MAETKFLDNAGLTHLFEKINAKFSKLGHKHTKADITDFAHSHNDLYYGKTEVDSKLSGKSNTSHNHDDRYYTESEINSKLAGKSDTSHSHSTHLTTEIAASTDLNTITNPGWYKCSGNGTAAGLKNCPTQYAFALEVLSNAGTTQKLYEYRISGQKVYTRNYYYNAWGEWKRVYTTADKPTAGEIGAAASSHTHTKSQITDFAHTHDDRYYTETEVDSKLSGKANSSHTHTKSQITDFPTSMPASDVYAWAKAPTKPSYSKAEVGLGNVDNTADSAKSVKYATSATRASTADRAIEIADYNNTNQGIKIGYAGAGFTSADFKYALGMNSERKIKDVSQSEYRKWLGLGSAAYTSSDAYAPASHSHNYAGSSSAGGSANWANGANYANYAFSNNGVSTSGNGSAYTATVGGFSLATGKSIVMIPHVTSTTTTPTLNVSGTGAKTIRMRLSSSTSSTIPLIYSSFLAANKPVKVTYDGTYWVIDDFIQPDANNLYGTLISRGSSAPSSGTAGFIYIQTT